MLYEQHLRLTWGGFGRVLIGWWLLFGGVVFIFVCLVFVLFFCGELREGHTVIKK